jgi:hypothetical protein
VSKEALLQVFQPFGDVDSVALKPDYAFVNFTRRSDAAEAKRRLAAGGAAGPLLPGTQACLVMKFAKVNTILG